MMKQEYTLDCILRAVKNIELSTNRVIGNVTERDISVLKLDTYEPVQPIDTTSASAVVVVVNNKGASTGLEVAAYGTLDGFPHTSTPVMVAELDSTTNPVEIMIIPTSFDKLQLVFTNGDGANDTVIDYTVKIYGTSSARVIESVIDRGIVVAKSSTYQRGTYIDTTSASVVTVVVDNVGASTELEVAAYCTINGFPLISKPIMTTELVGANKTEMMVIPTFFDTMQIIVSNKDAVNDTTVDCAIKVYGNTLSGIL